MLAFVGWAVWQLELGFALFVCSGWHGLLRPDEVLSLLCEDLQDRVEVPVVLRIIKPKTKWPRVEHVLLLDEAIIGFAHAVAKSRAELSASLCGLGLLRLRSLWERALKHLCLATPLAMWASDPGLRFTPAGLRPGGATEFYLRTQNIGALQWRGRWRSPSTLEHYLQMGMSYLVQTRLAKPSKTNVAELAAIGREFWDSFKESTA